MYYAFDRRMVVASKASHLFAFCVASVAAHAAALTLMGHSRSEGVVKAATPDPAFAEISISEPVPDAALEAPEPAVRAQAPSGLPTKHTHVYPVRADHNAQPHDPAVVHAPWPSPQSPQPASAPEAAAIESPPAPRFTVSLKGGSPTFAREPPVSNRAGATSVAASGDGASEPMPEAQVSSKALLLGAVSPAYPAEARAQEIEANVVLALVVSSLGAVEDARVVKGAGFGFDEAALSSIRRARFVPARHQGQAVAVRMRWTVSFRLR